LAAARPTVIWESFNKFNQPTTMTNRSIRPHQQTLGTGILFLVAASLCAQPQAFTQGGTGQPAPPLAGPEATTTANVSSNWLDKVFNGKIPEVIEQGKFDLNVRLRYEQVDADIIPGMTKNSYVPTIRTRFGYTTASLYGFDAMLEGVNISTLGPEHNYNAAGSNGQGARPSVGDPPMTRFDQVWLGYSTTNYVDFSAKVGQQQINLDNQRFIGDAGWRQNMQTYEAARAEVAPIKNLELLYTYIWEVDRVYGDVSGLPAANTDFNSHSHLINLSYSGWKYGRFTGYAYLLDLYNSGGNANSCATYGGSFAGATSVFDKVMLDYRAEFAWQSQYANDPQRFSADYYNLELGASYKPLAIGSGYEVLGSGANTGTGGGRVGFKTPLASPHPFNGWAEVFVTHPADGLQDIYEYAQVTLPYEIPIRFVYHKYYADYGNGDYGQEFDAVISKKFGKYWSAMLEFAQYLGENKAPPAITATHMNNQSVWATVEFIF
jgi:hypothetical protein